MWWWHIDDRSDLAFVVWHVLNEMKGKREYAASNHHADSLATNWLKKL
jgi:hypothetical protein